MAVKNWLVAVTGLCLLNACSGEDPDQLPNPAGTGGAAGSGANGGAGGSAGTQSSGGTSGLGTGGGGGSPMGSGGNGGGPMGAGGGPMGAGGGPMGAGGGGPGGFDYEAQTVRLDADLVIPAGTAVRVGPGVTFNAAPNVTIQVQGTLIVTASAASPSSFMGTAAAPNSWKGIVVAAGGNLQMQHARVGGATLGVHTLKGSTYDIDYVTFDTSFKGAVLESDGKINHSRFLATVPPTISVAADVTIDDPNGTLTIITASPTVTNSEFIGASMFTDLVRVGGNSAPLFDHDTFKAAHCGFHIFGATTSFTAITNSVIEGMTYGVMAFTTKPNFRNNVFKGNANDAGFCFGATSANKPIFDGNYYASGGAVFDASCVQAGTTATNTATAAIPGAGPVGL
jgi:hypothetical protein